MYCIFEYLQNNINIPEIYNYILLNYTWMNTHIYIHPTSPPSSSPPPLPSDTYTPSPHGEHITRTSTPQAHRVCDAWTWVGVGAKGECVCVCGMCECVFIWRLGGGVGGVGSGKRGGCSGGRWLVDTHMHRRTKYHTTFYKMCLCTDTQSEAQR